MVLAASIFLGVIGALLALFALTLLMVGLTCRERDLAGWGAAILFLIVSIASFVIVAA